MGSQGDRTVSRALHLGANSQPYSSYPKKNYVLTSIISGPIIIGFWVELGFFFSSQTKRIKKQEVTICPLALDRIMPPPFAHCLSLPSSRPPAKSTGDKGCRQACVCLAVSSHQHQLSMGNIFPFTTTPRFFLEILNLDASNHLSFGKRNVCWPLITQILSWAGGLGFLSPFVAENLPSYIFIFASTVQVRPLAFSLLCYFLYSLRNSVS